VTAWKPVRPEIINVSGIFCLSEEEHQAVTWYKLEGSSAIPVSNQTKFKPMEKGTYVATIKKGFGWLVSKPFVF